MAFTLIIDKWSRDPDILNYWGDDETPTFERRVTTVYNSDEHGKRVYDVIDPYHFELIKTDHARIHYDDPSRRQG